MHRAQEIQREMSVGRASQHKRLARAVSRLLGWSYFLCWSASFYPQPLMNWRRKSTHGFTIEYPTLNVLGFLSYTISTSAFLYSSTIRSQYAARNPVSPEPTVAFNDLAFAAHALILCILTYSQFWSSLWGFNKVGGRQRLNRPVAGVFWGSLIAVIIVVFLVTARGGEGGKDPAGWAWIDVIYTIGYIKLVVTVIKYIPQAWDNFKRKSTVGWSIGQILLDVSGGVLSNMQLIIDSSLQNDWSGITGNPVKLGLANVSICFDIIFIMQHFWFYRDARKPKPEEDGSGDSSPSYGDSGYGPLR